MVTTEFDEIIATAAVITDVRRERSRLEFERGTTWSGHEDVYRGAIKKLGCAEAEATSRLAGLLARIVGDSDLRSVA